MQRLLYSILYIPFLCFDWIPCNIFLLMFVTKISWKRKKWRELDGSGDLLFAFPKEKPLHWMNFWILVKFLCKYDLFNCNVFASQKFIDFFRLSYMEMVFVLVQLLLHSLWNSWFIFLCVHWHTLPYLYHWVVGKNW